MKRVAMLLLFFVGAVALLSGCAVIDFLDGKHLGPTSDYDRPPYGGGYSGGNSGGGRCH